MRGNLMIPKKIYLDPVTEMTDRTFRIEYEEAHDITGYRNHQFIKRNVEPIYKPVEGLKTISEVPIHLIVDMIHKNISISFNSDSDLFDIVNIIQKYLKHFNGKIELLDKTSDDYLFFERCQKAFFILSDIKREREMLLRKRNNGKITGIDRLPLRRD